MGRHYIHLSVDSETATNVAERRNGAIAIIQVKALEAYNEGISFYKGGEEVWLADHIHPKYLKKWN